VADNDVHEAGEFREKCVDAFQDEHGVNPPFIEKAALVALNGGGM